MSDLTIIYYTANRLKPFFADNVRKILLKAADGLPIISVSQKPLDFGTNICVGTENYSGVQIYRQLLIGAKAANTKYLATAEDDILYSREHFRTYSPKDNEFAYDFSRWALYTWVVPPTYSLKRRRVLSTMIAPRNLLIETLEERFDKYPSGGPVYSEPGKYEAAYGLTPRKSVEFWSHCPSIVFTHEQSFGFEVQGKKKALGELRAYDIPFWGKASDILTKIYGER